MMPTRPRRPLDGARLLVALSLLVACTTTPGPSTDATAAPTDRFRQKLPPAPFVCRYALNPWFLPAGTLRTDHDGPLVLSLRGPETHKAGVEFTLPFGDASQGVRAEFTSRWVTFRGAYLPEKPLRLKLNKPLQVTPHLRWARGGGVQWLGSTGNLLRVAFERPDELPGEPWTDVVPCPDTTIGDVTFSFGDDETPSKDLPELVLPAKTSLPLSAEPGAAPVETYRNDEEFERHFRVVEEREGHVKLRVPVNSGRIVLWAPRSALRAPDEGRMAGILGSLGVGGLGARAGEGRGTPEYARCAAEAWFGVRIDGHTHPLGTLWKNAAWQEGARVNDLVEFTLPELDWIVPAPGATFVMTEAAADACRGGPRPSAP